MASVKKEGKGFSIVFRSWEEAAGNRGVSLEAHFKWDYQKRVTVKTVQRLTTNRWNPSTEGQVESVRDVLTHEWELIGRALMESQLWADYHSRMPSRDWGAGVEPVTQPQR